MTFNNVVGDLYKPGGLSKDKYKKISLINLHLIYAPNLEICILVHKTIYVHREIFGNKEGIDYNDAFV